MKSKKVIKTLAMGTAGLVAATTGAEGVVTAQAYSGGILSTRDPNETGSSASGYSYDYGSQSQSQSQTYSNNNDENYNYSYQENQSYNSQQTPVVNASNTGVSAQFDGDCVIRDGILYFKTLSLKVSVVSLAEGVDVTAVSLEDTQKNEISRVSISKETIVSTLPIEFKNGSTKINGSLVLRFWYSDGTTDTRDISTIIDQCKKIRGYASDTEAPILKAKNFSGDVVHSGKDEYCTKDGVLSFTFEDTGSGISAISSDKQGYLQGNTINIDTSALPEGESTVTVYCEDYCKNVFQETFTVNMMRQSPKLTGVSHSEVALKDNICYTKEPLNINLDGADNSKIAMVELLRNDTYYSNISNSFTISETGTYVIKVTDVVGNVTLYRLEDLFSDLNSNVVLDKEYPTISAKVNGKEIQDGWVTEDAVLQLSFADANSVASASVTVNSKQFDYSYQGQSKAVENIDLKNDVPRAQDGIYNVHITLVDIAGNVFKRDYSIKADFDKPTLNLTCNGNALESNGVTYLKGEMTIQGTGLDVGSGVKSIELLNRGVVVSNKLPFKITESGVYKVKITDYAGLSNEYDLSEFLEMSGTITTDNEAPKIERVDGFKPDLELGKVLWYKTHPKVRFDVSDSNLKSVKVVVNGNEYTTGVENGSYIIDTTEMSGTVDIYIRAEDYAGNVSEDSYKFSIDSDVPTISGLKVNKDYVTKGGKLFFKESPALTVVAKDDGIGIGEYILGGDKSERNANGVFQLNSGSYTLKVTDKLDNETKETPISTWGGFDSNVIVVDGEAPTIETSRPDSVSGDWYAKDILYNIKVRDNQGIDSVKVTLNDIEVDSFVTENTTTSECTVQADTSKVPVSENGSYALKVVATDNAGNQCLLTDTVYVDTTAPTINKFVFNGNGYQDGAAIDGKNRYGFIFNGSATCDIYVSDGKGSSGLKNLHVVFESTTGSKSSADVKISGGVGTVALPKDFKGFVYAYAEDNVGNVSSTEMPDGVITEGSNCHINDTTLTINMPNSDSVDSAGNTLYNHDVKATADIGCSMSGLKTVTWGIDSKTIGTITVDGNGNVSGDYESIKAKDKNLVLSLTSALSLSGNANGMKIWVTLVDKAGHTSEASRIFSIDKDSPVISVSYSDTNESNYYNKDRSATISIKERNFDQSKVKIDGSYGVLGTWKNSGDTWTNTLTFAEDKNYNFTISCVDRAGNVSDTYSSEKFTVDKTAPVLSVSWNDAKPLNGNYYKEKRVATVTITETGFDPSLVRYKGSGVLSDWSSDGNTHTATITFDSDGEQSFAIAATDKAGNKSETYKCDKFILDKTSPELKIDGVQTGMSYKNKMGFTVKVSDDLIDKEKTSVTLTGRKKGNIKLEGTWSEKEGVYKFENLPETEENDDLYTLKVVVTDLAGNTKKETVKFSVNRFGSKYTFSDPTVLGNYLNAPKDVVIKEENVDKLDTNKARVSVIKDGLELSIPEDCIKITESGGKSGSYTYTYSISKDAFTEDGKYLIQIYSKSEEGTDYSSISEEYTFVLDTTPPEVIFSGIESGKQYKDYKKKLIIDVRDLSGVETITAKLNGKKVNLAKSNGVYSLEVIESSDTQSVEVEVTDLAGNTSTSKVSDFKITSDTGSYLVNQLWFKMGIGALVAFLGVIIGLLARSLYVSRKKEFKSIKEHEELYRASSSGGASSSTGSGSSGKDLAEDLEKPELHENNRDQVEDLESETYERDKVSDLEEPEDSDEYEDNDEAETGVMSEEDETDVMKEDDSEDTTEAFTEDISEDDLK